MTADRKSIRSLFLVLIDDRERLPFAFDNISADVMKAAVRLAFHLASVTRSPSWSFWRKARRRR